MGINRQAKAKIPAAVFGVTVKPGTVIKIDIAGGWHGQRLGSLVDGIVVEFVEHGGTPDSW